MYGYSQWGSGYIACHEAALSSDERCIWKGENPDRSGRTDFSIDQILISIYTSQPSLRAGARFRNIGHIAGYTSTCSTDAMGLQDTETVIPGTEVVYRETDGDSNSSRELVLIPNPTNNEDDPLVSSS